MTPRLFIRSNLSTDSIITLEKNHSNYLVNVLRLDINAELLVFNGFDGEWSARLLTSDCKSAQILILKQTKIQTSLAKLTLLFSPTKNINSTYIVEKATELGATEIYPVITQRSVVKKINMDKLLYSAVEAAEQCERIDVPQIHDIISLKQALRQIETTTSLVFFDESKNCLSVNSIKIPNANKAVLVGPEGGFTEAERSFLLSQENCIAAHMGQRILRADTAVIAGLAAVQAIFGDWKNV